MADTPVGYWRNMGGISGVGSHLADHSGNNRYMTLWNNGSSAADYPRDAASLILDDTVDPSIEFIADSNFWNPDHWSALDFTTGMSMSYWMKYAAMDASTWHDLVLKGTMWGTRLEPLGSGQLGVSAWITPVAGAAVTVTSTAVDVGATYHVALTYDQTNIRLYLNNIEAASAVMPSAPRLMDVSSGQSFVFAQYAGNVNGYNGILDEIAVYDHNIGPGRVSAHYHAGIGV